MEIHKFRDILLEFSFPKKEIERFILGYSRTFVEHLVKILILNTQESKDYWTNEIFQNYVLDLNDYRLKPKATRPNYKIYFTYLFERKYILSDNQLDMEIISKTIERVKVNYNANSEIPDETIGIALLHFMKKFCTIISQKDVSCPELENLINSMILETLHI